MTATDQSKPNTSFWIIGVLALLWNLSGMMTFFMEVFITPEALAALPEAERALYETSPAWMKVVFAIAVFGGTLGCIFLLIRKTLAIQLFIISLAAVLIQMLYYLTMTKAVEVYGLESFIMPLIVIAIAVFLVWYSKNTKAKGWIN
ncbi:MAG: hypothetical protein KAQ62_00675 [Cyclobacteriaceae bacterium]|nr:hypothetical protein [Cyclobacteriaceae bacterium]